MVYRRTDKVARRLAARRAAILAAAQAAAAEGGMGAVHIAPVARRAGIAAGTVYRYFPSKTELVAALVAAVSERELGAMRQAADAAPGPLSALAAAIATFAARALAQRRLAWAVLAEPVDAETDSARQAFRKALAGEVEARLSVAIRGRHLPAEPAANVAAAAIVGALLAGLVGPLAPEAESDRDRMRDLARGLTLFALRAVGLLDARAWGLVMQTAPPIGDDVSVDVTSSGPSG